MIGAVAGDIIGSIYESNNIKRKDFPLFSTFCRFTDDTVLSVAVAHSILSGIDYTSRLKEYYSYYPHAGYGGYFHRWASSSSGKPYNSWGNGSAMRVSPVGFAFNTLDRVLEEAEKSAAVTHNHPEGIKGAQATAAAVFMSRKGCGKDEIKGYIEDEFGYDLSRRTDDIRPGYGFDVSCQGSVPEAIISFLESTDFEDAIRLAVSLGGDSDTIACITGGIAHAYYRQVPVKIESRVYEYLDSRLIKVIDEFRRNFNC
jgi:ADP-ribosylglycohydrolase